jgi:hypothetical protein
MNGAILGACFFGMTSVVAVETPEGIDLRVNNTLSETPGVQQCRIDAGYVLIDITWTPYEGTVPDDLSVVVSPGWQAFPAQSTIKDNNWTINKDFDHVWITPELMG